MNPASQTSQLHQVGKQLKYFIPSIVEMANKRKHYVKSTMFNSPPIEAFRFLADLDFGASPTFLDVGANYGQSAISMRHFVPDCRIRCIEANPSLAECLLYLARKLGNLDVLITAAGNEYSVLDLRIPVLGGVVNTGGASLSAEFVSNRRGILEDHYGAELALLSQTVPSIPLDVLNIEPSFIKIDVEGNELSVLFGLTKTIRRCNPVIMLETLHSDGRAAEWLITNGYRLYALNSDGEIGSTIASTEHIAQIQDIVALPTS